MKVLLPSLACAVVMLSDGTDAQSQPLPAKGAAAPLTVQTVRARRGEISRWLVLPANIRAFQQTTLHAKTAGYLKSIAVDRGDHVKAGDLMAEIESPELLADVAKYKAEIEVAQSQLKRLTEAAQKAPDLVTPLAVDEARAKLEVARAAFERNQTLLGFSRIVAPFAGVITRRWVDPGALIPAATSAGAAQNAAIVTLMDFASVRVEVAVPEADVPFVRTGLVARISVEELPARLFEGRVTRMAYALDEATKTMLTEIDIANPQAELRPGMYATCRLAAQTKTDALLLPLGALLTEKTRTSVFKVVGGQARKTPAKVGFQDETAVEILEGVAPEDVLILVGKQALNDGQPVQASETK